MSDGVATVPKNASDVEHDGELAVRHDVARDTAAIRPSKAK